MNQFTGKTLGQAMDQMTLLALRVERCRQALRESCNYNRDENHLEAASETYLQAEQDFALAFDLGQSARV